LAGVRRPRRPSVPRSRSSDGAVSTPARVPGLRGAWEYLSAASSAFGTRPPTHPAAKPCPSVRDPRAAAQTGQTSSQGPRLRAREILERDGKCGKDRDTVPPENMILPLQQQGVRPPTRVVLSPAATSGPQPASRLSASAFCPWPRRLRPTTAVVVGRPARLGTGTVVRT
jgi:hypothetical protein